MALLGAALAPVIHCSNWANRSIIFCGDSKASAKPLPSEDETRGSAFGYLDAQRVLANPFGANKLYRDSKAWDGDLFPDGDGMLGTGLGASQKLVSRALPIVVHLGPADLHRTDSERALCTLGSNIPGGSSRYARTAQLAG